MPPYKFQVEPNLEFFPPIEYGRAFSEQNFTEYLALGMQLGSKPIVPPTQFSKAMDTEAFEPQPFPCDCGDSLCNQPICDNKPGGVVYVDPWVDPVFQVVEIGPFGRPEHLAMDTMFLDTWEDNEGHVQVRRMPVPDHNFVVTSGGLPIYLYVMNGLWLGSEMIRRGATA